MASLTQITDKKRAARDNKKKSKRAKVNQKKAKKKAKQPGYLVIK
jgi:hypothetical protein